MLLAFVLLGVTNAFAQNSKADKQAAIKSKIDSKNYTFVANYVRPQRGGGHPLTDSYDLRVKADSVVAFLPYFGQAYFDVPYNPTDGGIKFQSTNFTYKADQQKKGNWVIHIQPKDAKHTRELILNVSKNGYASLTVNSTNRDFITFNGYIQ